MRVHRKCSAGALRLKFRCSAGVDYNRCCCAGALQVHCGCSAGAVRAQCRYGLHQVQCRCSAGAVLAWLAPDAAVWAQGGCRASAVRVLFGCTTGVACDGHHDAGAVGVRCGCVGAVHACGCSVGAVPDAAIQRHCTRHELQKQSRCSAGGVQVSACAEQVQCSGLHQALPCRCSASAVCTRLAPGAARTPALATRALPLAGGARPCMPGCIRSCRALCALGFG